MPVCGVAGALLRAKVSLGRAVNRDLAHNRSGFVKADLRQFISGFFGGILGGDSYRQAMFVNYSLRVSGAVQNPLAVMSFIRVR